VAIDADPELNPYLQGNYAPVHDELDIGDLEVTGEIPTALDGAYLRNGPNPAFAPLGRYHIFDGDGMIHAVHLAGGTARYANRWVDSRGLQAERKAGQALFGGLSNFSFPPPEVMEEAGMMKNTANTNVVRHAGHVLALLEAAKPTELTLDLETLGEYDFDGRLPGAMTAHPKFDPATGEMLLFGYSPFPPFLRYHVVDATGALVRSEDIEIPASVMMHDFVCTTGHVVFFDLPAVFDINAISDGRSMIRWEPDNGARIGVMPRNGNNDDIRWFELDPFFVFHFLNGWDDGDTVVVDGCRSPRMPTSFGDDDVFDEPVAPHLTRWRLNLASGKVTTEQLDDRGADFPRLNDAHAGAPNRYGYVATIGQSDDLAAQFDGVVKYDLEQGTEQVHRYPDSVEGGEAVFAPDPDGTAEDDGWLLDIVYDRAADASHLVILDAHDLTAEPVARVHLPRRVPFGFHGNWLPTHS
jgi:carotenoid cleavage dioxygenase-like enzyme